MEQRHPHLLTSFRPLLLALAALAALTTIARPQTSREGSRTRTPAAQEALVPPAPEPELLQPPPALPAAAMRRDPRAIHHMEGSDGTLWVRGASYKASFGAAGATFIPFLGSDAPQNYPVRMSLASVSIDGVPLPLEPAGPVTRDGETISLARGTLVERYAIRVDAIEQSFVFEELPSRGELVLRIAVESELAGREEPEALVFENGLGGVRYGRATALDARGHGTPAATTWTDSGIEIRVPADFVASARLPLVIDPWVQGFSITWGALDEFLPDVAFDATTGRWIVVYEEIFSASDHDVIRLMLAYDGTPIVSPAYVDSTPTEYWANPAVANNAGTSGFLVVAEVGLPSAGMRVVRGRIMQASTGNLGANLLISDALSGEKVNPDVGGDWWPGTDPAFTGYLVVWQRNRLSTDFDIHGRYVGAAGLLGTAFAISATVFTQDQRPSISKVARSILGTEDSRWAVVWERFNNASFDTNIWGAMVEHPSTITIPSFTIDGSTLSNDRYPDVSSPRSDNQGNAVYLVVNQRDSGAEHDIVARLMTNSTSTDVVNLTALEDAAGAGNLTLDQMQPSTDLVWGGWVVAYSELAAGSTTNYDVRMSTMGTINEQLLLGESHVSFGPAGSSPTPETNVAVAAAYPGNGDQRRCLMAYQDATGGTALGNIEGFLYDSGQYTSFCHPGVDGTLACPCSNPSSSAGRGCSNGSTGGAILSMSGVASLLADSAVMTSGGEPPTALSIFNQGDALTNPATGVVFGQGVRCVGGSLKRLYVKSASGGVAVAPGGGDPSVHMRSAALGDTIIAGSSRYYYVYYRQTLVLGGCPSASTFNTTQSIRAIWAP